VGNNQKVTIVKDNAPLCGIMKPNLQVEVTLIQKQEALGKDMVDDKLSKEHEALKHILQILTNAKVCDDSNLASCKNWGVYIRSNIHI
jgi:hypothetical protein